MLAWRGVLFASLALCACSGSKSTKLGVLAPDAGDTRVHAVFRLSSGTMSFGDVPWPDDTYLDAGGRIAVRDIPSADATFAVTLRDALAELDGFGMRPTIYFRFDGPIDPSSLPATPDDSLSKTASVFLMDADTSSPDAFKRIPIELRYDAVAQELRVRPSEWRALAPGRRYAAVVSDRVKSAAGVAIAASSGFRRVRDRELALPDLRERGARAMYAPVIAELANQKLGHEHVAALAVFHVQTRGDDLVEARGLVPPDPTPVFTEALSGARLDEVFGVPPASALGIDQGGGPHAHIGWMVNGSFPSPNLLATKPGVHGHGVFKRDQAGKLIQQGTTDVYFTLFLPHNEAFTDGYPVAIVQHGLGRERSDALPLANELASSGYAVVAIDAPFHGLRSIHGDSRNRFTGAGTPDGFGDADAADAASDFFALTGDLGDVGELGVLHPYFYRDAVRQGVVDLASLVRLLQTADWNGLGKLNESLKTVMLNTTRLSLIGIDLGGEMGAMLATIEPSVWALVLGFSSGLTLDAWAQSPGQKAIVDALLQRLGHDPATVDWQADSPLLWPDIDAWRTLVDRGCAAAYAPALRRAPINVLMLMARDDEVVHNLGTEALAELIGADFAAGTPRYVSSLPSVPLLPGTTLRANFPPDSGSVTRALYQFDPATHDALVRLDDTSNYVAPLERPFLERMPAEPITNPLQDTFTQIRFLLESLRSCQASNDALPAGCAASVQAPGATK